MQDIKLKRDDEMTYSIKEVAEKTGLSIYTLRYYDKQGLLPFVSRNEAGYREFTDSDLNFIHTICCLKNTDMKIKDIKKYIGYCMQGAASIDDRRQLLLKHRQEVLAKQRLLADNLKEIDYKLNVYTDPNSQAIIDREVAYVQDEKAKNHLADPFAVK